MNESSSFVNSLINRGLEIEGDLASIEVYLNRFSTSQGSLKEGYFFFIEDPMSPNVNFTGAFYLVSKAICFLKINEQYYGHVDTFNISNLISSLSFKMDANGDLIKASKLYGVPRSSEQADWNGLKYIYLKEKIVRRGVQVISCDQANSVTWRFVDKEDDLSGIQKYIPTEEFEKFKGSDEFRNLMSSLGLESK